MTRNLSNQDIQEMDKMYLERMAHTFGNDKKKDKRKGKDRRVAISSCIHPSMDRRCHNRRQKDNER